MLSASAVGFLVVVAVFAGVAFPANAASLWPSGFNPKQLMINVLSSVLSAAGPTSPTKRAVIAADQKYDHSWEALEQQWKQSSSGAPGTYDDYVLQKQKYFADNNMTSKQGELGTGANVKKYVKTASIPATKAVGFLKSAAGAGVVVAAVEAWTHRADIADGAVAIVGVDDATGAVCANSAFLQQNGGAAGGITANLQNTITGRDCNAWKQSANYVSNSDVIPRAAGWLHDDYSNGTGVYPYDHLYYRFQMSVTPDGSSGTISGRVVAMDFQAMGEGYQSTVFDYQCTGTDPNTNGPYLRTVTVNFPTRAQPSRTSTSVWACPTGQTLYAIGRQGGSTTQIADKGVTWQNQPSDPQYFGPSSPNYVPGVSTDPARVMTCTVTGTDGQTYTASSPSFKESSGSFAAPVCPVLPGGVGIAQVKAQETGGGSPAATVIDQPTTPAYQAWYTAYPECHEGACALDLLRKDTNVSCFDTLATAAICVDWMKDPTKAADYQCMYGTHAVDLTECNVYGDVFKPDKVTTGQAYTDPTTGESVGGQSSPTAAQTALLRGITDPQDFTGCLDKGWAAANPVEWVMVPVQCALQWAFVAPQSTFTDAGVAIQAAWKPTFLGQIGDTFAQFQITATSSGCKGPRVDIPRYMNADAYPLNACSGVLQTMAAFTNGITIVGFSVAALWALMNASGAIFGWSFRGEKS